MTRIQRQTYANKIKLEWDEYEKVHGIVEAYGGRVKDCKLNWQTEEMVLFYEMPNAQREEFEKELFSK
jgi:hypothetical protein